MQKGIILISMVIVLFLGGLYYYWPLKPDMAQQFNVPNETIAKDLEGRTVPLLYGQAWPFEANQNVIVTVVAKKQVEDYVVVVVKISAQADVVPTKEEKQPPPGIKSLKVGLGGIVKLTYEKIDSEWYIVGLENVSLRAYPLAEPAVNHAVVIILEKVTSVKETKQGLYAIVVKIDRTISNHSGRLEFSDNKYALIDEYIRSEGPRLKETNEILVYLDLNIAPLGIKNVKDFESKLPLKVNVYQ